MIQGRPIFKNKKNSFDDIFKSDYDMDNDITDELDIYDSSKIKEYDEDDDEDIKILDDLISGNYKKVKKDRKKKEKKEKKKQKKQKDKDKKKQRKREEELLDLDELYELDEKKINKKKLDRGDEEFYESRFNGSLIILRELLKQVNKQVVTAEQLQEYFKNAKIRGALTALSNQGANISSLLSTKLSVIKEITNINKTISDLELKKAKELKDSNADNTQNTDYIINEIFKNVVNDDVDVSSIKFDDDDDDDDKKSKKKKKKKKKQKRELSADDMHDIVSEEDELTLKSEEYDDEEDDEDYEDFDPDEFDDDEDALEARCRELEEDGKIEFSDSEKAYKYEGKVEIVVVKNPRTERWKFMAIDKHGDEIYDYPLPKKNKRNTMTFDKEHGYAKDKLNNVYKIMYYDENDSYMEDDY